MKNTILILFAVILFVVAGCTKEDPIPPSAVFTTDLVNNTIQTGEKFTVYLDQVKGEFLCYFQGDKESTTFDPNDYSKQGRSVSIKAESFQPSAYRNAGTYTFTLVASSSGNWGKDYEQDYYSIEVTVVE